MGDRPDIEPMVRAFCGGSIDTLQSLSRAARAISDSVHGGRAYSQRVTVKDFNTLKLFVAAAAMDFAVVEHLGDGVFPVVEATDRQRSKDGYGPEDWNQL